MTAQTIIERSARIRALADRRDGRAFPVAAFREQIIALAREARGSTDDDVRALAAELERAARMVREETY